MLLFKEQKDTAAGVPGPGKALPPMRGLPFPTALQVAALAAEVDARWAELLVQAGSAAAGGGGGGSGGGGGGGADGPAEVTADVAAVGWGLAAAAAELGDVGLSALAARLLAAAGPDDPRAPPRPAGLTAEGGTRSWVRQIHDKWTFDVLA